MQIIADITNYPIWTIREDVEAAARLAALGCGLALKNNAGWITLTERARPNPTIVEHYRKIFAVYLDVYPALANA